MKELILFHSIMRWVVFLLLTASVLTAFNKWLTRKGSSRADYFLYMFSAISFHTQILVGLILYFLSPKVQFNEHTMKEAVIRFFTVEHGFMMLLAFVMLLTGRKLAEKTNDPTTRHRRYAIWFGIALLLIIAAIPWPFRTGLGVGWI